LIDIGVDFTREPGGTEFHLTREGGHSTRRIIHSADATGRAVSSTLSEQALAQKNIACLKIIWRLI
jgi:L-aspartate oxidase